MLRQLLEDDIPDMGEADDDATQQPRVIRPLVTPSGLSAEAMVANGADFGHELTVNCAGAQYDLAVPEVCSPGADYDDMADSAADDIDTPPAQGGTAAGKGRWGSGGKDGVQRTIDKCSLGGLLGAKGKGKVKGKGKLGLKGKGVVLIPGPGNAPDRNKVTREGHGGVLSWASSEMRGWRPAMEDATCALVTMDAPLETHAMFGVFDGHGGAIVSRKAAEELPAEVLNSATWALQSAEESNEEGIAERALRLALPMLDNALRETASQTASEAQILRAPVPSDVDHPFCFMGSTAVVALVECDGSPLTGAPSRIVVANCGDSRAVLCRGGQAVAMSEDQKPELPAERARIENAGGFVAPVGPCQRIDGWGLNLSRALGDFHYKARSDLPPEEQKVTAVPEIRTCELTDEDEFLLLGCDGVFELKSSQDAVDLVRTGLMEGKPTTEVVEELVDSCCSSNLFQTQGHGGDNVSAMVVLLR